MPKISVIVPVYNVEKYLDRCVNSIRNQTLSDIEIILVDDGSPDGCPALCDKFAQEDSRIKVVHKENGGLSSARNAGISVATGKYIGFVDSDDFIDFDMYEKLFECAEDNTVDFVMEDYWRVPVSGDKWVKTLDIRGGLYQKEDIKNEIFPMLIMRENVDYGPLLSVCHCLYNTDFLSTHNCYFDEEIRWSEDCIFSAILGYKANSFYYMKGICGYNYCQNEGTISTSYKPASWDVYCLMNERLHTFFDDCKDYDFSRQLDLHMLYFACSVFNQLKYANYTKAQKRSVYKRILNDNHLIDAFKNLRLPSVPVKFKIRLILMKLKAVHVLTIWVD